MEDTLQQPEEQRRYYEALIEASPTAIAIGDAEFRIRTWNPAAEKLFGFSQEEAIGRHIDDLLSANEEFREEARAVNREMILSGRAQRFTRRTRKDGSFVDVALRAAPIMVGDRFAGVYAFYDDIGELVRQRRYFESLLQISPAAVVMVDRSLVVTSWNPAAEALFGYSAEEAIGTNLDDLVATHPEIHEEAVRYTEEAWGSSLFKRAARRTRKDGSLVDVEISAVPVILDSEQIAYYIIYHDISELAHARRQLEARVDEQMAELVRTGQLAKFLPRQVAEGLLAGQLAPEVGFERRRITVLFADMVGFTDLSETLEPEELSELLNEYLRQMTSAVLANGGTLDNFIGDGIMAVFGAPEAMPETEQALSAVRAAIEMRRRGRDLAGNLRAKGIPADLDIRVGLNTGRCTVGVFGSDVIRAYKAVGFAVNVAARLQSAAEAGSILCGFRTYALIRDQVTAEPRDPLRVKGAARPVEAWEITGLLGSA